MLGALEIFQYHFTVLFFFGVNSKTSGLFYKSLQVGVSRGDNGAALVDDLLLCLSFLKQMGHLGGEISDFDTGQYG